MGRTLRTDNGRYNGSEGDGFKRAPTTAPGTAPRTSPTVVGERPNLRGATERACQDFNDIVAENWVPEDVFHADTPSTMEFDEKEQVPFIRHWVTTSGPTSHVDVYRDGRVSVRTSHAAASATSEHYWPALTRQVFDRFEREQSEDEWAGLMDGPDMMGLPRGDRGL